ncbi:MAG: hypothetical protein HFI54_03315 [Lachnospiraceae bacterium]|nr:hypothetical protein [Lachnospiraceae bacterium]
MNGSRRYEYVMDEAEIREFCLRAFLEQLKCSKKTGIRLLVILAAELLLVPEAAALTVLLMAVMVAAVGIYNYAATSKILRGQPGSVWIEDGRLKAQRRDYGEIPCRDIKLLRRTKRLLMMGYMQGARRPVWFMIPLRSFRDGHEVDLFLAALRDPVTQENYYDQAYLRFQFQIDGERWVRLQKGAADLINGGSLGRSARTNGILIWGSVMTVVLTVVSCLISGRFHWMFVCYGFVLAVLMCLRLYCLDPEKPIRNQLKQPEVAARACGLWQVSLTEEGVSLAMPAGIRNVYLWASLAWLLETEEAFYLFHKDKKHFVMIAKESFLSWDQVDLFHRICADHGIQKIVPKKARYVPGWLIWTLLGVFLLALFGIVMVRAFLTERDEPGVVSVDVYERVPLEEQVEVLESLGLQVPEETAASVRSSMEEYGMYDLVEESPYTWLLTDMGAPTYDEEWNVTGYAADVFWFDFEGFDISTDYIDILNGMLALAEGSCLDDVTDIREDMTDADWESGRGTVTVSLRWKGEPYEWDMEMYNDWIDVSVLGILNPLLEQEGSQEYFYATGDNGQGAIVFFCTQEWAEQFTQKTGLVLEKMD